MGHAQFPTWFFLVHVPAIAGATANQGMWLQGRGARTLCSFCVEREPFRFWEMELPRNQLSCVATRGAPRLLRCFGDDSGDALGERLASIESCSQSRDTIILCLSQMHPMQDTSAQVSRVRVLMKTL